MKKLVLIVLCVSLVMQMSSCSKEIYAEELICEFLYSYSAVGVVYSPRVPEGNDGYVYDGFTEKIYIYEGDFPSNYAIFLNSHADYGAECGVFVCEDEDERARVTDMCEERIELLSKGGENAFISRAGRVVFYSTMKNRVEAEEIWRKIIRSHT